MKHIWILNGPNLNFLGIREPAIYGKQDYKALEEAAQAWAQEEHIDIKMFQSNSEGTLIDILQKAYYEHIDGIVFNAGAYTHYSYAIRDAIASVQIPTVEVHLSDVNNREDFRKISVIRPVCVAEFHGHGFESYHEGLLYLIKTL